MEQKHTLKHVKSNVNNGMKKLNVKLVYKYISLEDNFEIVSKHVCGIQCGNSDGTVCCNLNRSFI